MIIDKKTGKAFTNLWFGNFYRPAYDDENFVRKAVELIKNLGFNSVLLDSKAWEDFRERFNGGEASQYVKMQEFLQKELIEQGISYDFLSLYLNGDNLYPNIRFSPPIYGESVVQPDGRDGKWYRYWSPKARKSMEDHVHGLLKLYGAQQTVILTEDGEKKPMCSMWDPIVAPSFDEEGRKRYLTWLKGRYDGRIEQLNQVYGLKADSFETLKPEEYWFTLRFPDRTSFSQEEAFKGEPAFWILADNRRWQRDELIDYFKDMKERLHRLDKDLWLCPDLAQWGYFLNVDGTMLSGVGMADLWDTAVRGIDLYSLSKYVDCANFLSVPVTPQGDADIYVASCHHSMMRNMNRGREFVGGIYWGRFLYNHIYDVITPCETVASIAASGASGYTSYGMCGLDDGGVLHRMEEYFNQSLKRANEWLQEILPRLGKRKSAKTAILFPSAMALCETMRTENNKERRLDLLGYYHACLDVGADTDVVDGKILWEEDGQFSYDAVILPEDDCYPAERDLKLEQWLREFVIQGGWVIHSPGSRLAELAFSLKAQEHRADGVNLGEGCMVPSTCYRSYIQGEVLGTYLSDGAAAVVRQRIGEGSVVSLGFDYGYAYTAKICPHVPREQKNNELYPLNMIKRNLLKELLEEALEEKLDFHRNIEKKEFEHGILVINHTSYPYEVKEKGKRYDQYVQGENMLLPHSAVFIER